MGEPSKAGGERGKSNALRVVFIDQARALAITMMLIGHSLDRFLAEPWRSSGLYNDYQFIRGITSALFLMVSGFSFVVASFKYWGEYTRWSDKIRGRVRRIALIFLLGYTLHLWSPTLFQSWIDWTPEVWEKFLQFDILQNIAMGLLLMHLVVIIVRKPERFWKVTLAGWFVVIALGTLTFREDVDKLLPVELSVAVNMYHRSVFPLVPWMNFLLLGATFGYFFWTRMRKGDEWKVFVVGLGVAAVLILTEFAINFWIPGGYFPYSFHAKPMPGNIFARGGFALLFICVLYFVGRWKLFLPRLAFVLSKDSLAIYFIHLFLVYGGAWFLGLFPWMKQAMTPVQTLAWIVGLFAAMAIMAWCIGWMRKHRGVELRLLRHTLLGGFLSCFVIAPYLNGWELIVYVAASAWFFASLEWLLGRRRAEKALLAVEGGGREGLS